MPPVVTNLMESPAGETETFRTLLDLPSIRLEQIVSNGQASAEGFWYDQKEPEWVMLVRGTAVLRFDLGGNVDLKSGDFLLIPANTRHRVESVSADAVWLALHFST
ncbi:MAG: cupin domain-containing protein [Verrucomicrobiota bacterium]